MVDQQKKEVITLLGVLKSTSVVDDQEVSWIQFVSLLYPYVIFYVSLAAFCQKGGEHNTYFVLPSCNRFLLLVMLVLPKISQRGRLLIYLFWCYFWLAYFWQNWCNLFRFRKHIDMVYLTDLVLIWWDFFFWKESKFLDVWWCNKNGFWIPIICGKQIWQVWGWDREEKGMQSVWEFCVWFLPWRG